MGLYDRVKVDFNSERNDGYQWTVDSAVWQITHGGPSHRTLSAINFLNTEIGCCTQAVAEAALEALVTELGLQNLGEALAPLPDETETTTGFDNAE